jgi:hypothetical protein
VLGGLHPAYDNGRIQYSSTHYYLAEHRSEGCERVRCRGPLIEGVEYAIIDLENIKQNALRTVHNRACY